ncbi:MAG TPA: hypothetical protein VHE30_11855 [Polyangiaceae bacterium]|nr:hypothetical protein [Polyangiaceae bacterium]
MLHLPLTPVGSLLGLLSLLHAPEHEPPPEQLHAIPVSLLTPEEMAALGATNEPPPPPPPAAAPPTPEPAAPEAVVPEEPKPKPKPKPKPRPKPVADAGPASTDGGAPEPPKEHPAAPADGGAPAPPAEKTEKHEDPLALVGKATSVADPNANVKLLLLTKRIRTLPIAPRLGKLLARLPQWRSFFGPTGIDPIADIDGVYVAGPQFRVSADVVAVLEYGVPTSVMRKAIDGIVNREPKGEWYPTKVPAARARADRADRVFVLPKGKIVLMVPPHLKDDAVDKAPHLGFPGVPGRAVVVAFLATPWRALLGLPIPAQIPKSIASVSLSVTPTEDGGATLHIDAVDESPEAAKADAELLTRAVNLLTQRDVGALGALLFGGQTLRLIEPVELHADGKSVKGDAKVTERQLDRLLGFAEAWTDAINGGPPPLPASSTARPLPARPSPSPSGR